MLSSVHAEYVAGSTAFCCTIKMAVLASRHYFPQIKVEVRNMLTDFDHLKSTAQGTKIDIQLTKGSFVPVLTERACGKQKVFVLSVVIRCKVCGVSLNMLDSGLV